MVKASNRQKEAYQQLLQKHTPSRPIFRNLVLAFLVGGAITTIGQGVLNFFVSQGLSPKDAATPTAGVMIFLGALLTGLGVYDKIGKFAGMGSALPITGFANSIVSPALEFKREGFVLGVGARMFQVAGPVIVYGVVSSLVVSVLHILVKGV